MVISLGRLAALACITVGASVAVASAAELPDGAVVRTISPSTGSFDSGNGWSSLWTGSGDAPIVYMRSSRKDMMAAPGGTGLDLREGTAHSSTYTITTEGAWRVAGFDMSFVGNDQSNPVTVTSGSVSLTSSAEVQTLSVANLSEYESASFTLAGNNQGITTTDFTVTLVPVVPDEYIEVEIALDKGEFVGAASGQWRSLWQTTGDGPQLFLAAERVNGTVVSNMQPGNGGLDLREGAAQAGNYVISTAGSWRVSGFELTFRGNDDASPVKVSASGKTVTSSATEDRTLLVEALPYGTKATFSLEGKNAGITTRSFKVRLSPMSPDNRGVAVFTYTGSQPYSTVYRIPTLAYIPAGDFKGRIVAVNDFRPCGSDIGYGEVDLHQSISDDGGYTWSFPADPVDADGNHVADGDGQGTPQTSNQNRDCGFGDPSIVADRETGELLMLGVCGRIPIGQATRAIPQGLAVWHSTDGGQTWTPWRDITEEILTQLDDNCQYGAVDGLFFTAGRMIQSRYVKVGSHYRVYVVGGGRSASIPDTQCWVFYSDDLGKSWHILGDPFKPALTTGGSEPKCEELPDGSILYSGRAAGGRTFNVFTYTDYTTGEGYWDNAVFSRMVTGAASCNGDAMIVPAVDNTTGQHVYILMQSIPLHPSSRVNVGVNYKVLANGYDDFGTAQNAADGWDGSYQASNLPSAYSSLTLLPDGTLGFIYEEQTYGRDYTEIYRRLTVDQITHGAFSYSPDDNGETALSLTRQLVEGRRAKAVSDYPQRTELIQALDNAANAFNAEPSSATYINFNRALRGLIDGKPMPDLDPSGISAIAPDAPDADLPIYDLQGRRLTRADRPGLYIIGTTKHLVR